MKTTLLLAIIGSLAIMPVKVNLFKVEIPPEHVSILMRTFLPSIFSLFSNVTDAEFKATFKEPCKFEPMLQLFQGLPPYFEQMAKKFNDPELLAYYSMQLASTVLVNNGSLTMGCLYSMLTLQSRLNDFSLKIMDRPNEHRELVGHFGVFMQPIMSKLKDNAMMKIIEHVERYDKNDNVSTIYLFKFLNTVYCLFGLVAIVSNLFLIILLKQRPRAPTSSRSVHSSGGTRKNHPTKPKKLSTYDFLVQTVNKRYKTRICLIIIAACHSIYILVNFMVMSQASLASVALQGLTKLNLACKMAFFLFPPTTIYNVAHQLAIWLLVYAIRKHALKIRALKSFLVVNYELVDQSSNAPKQLKAALKPNQKHTNIYMSDSMIDEFSYRGDESADEHAPEKKSPLNKIHQQHRHPQNPRATSYGSQLDNFNNEFCICYFFAPKRKNALFSLCLLFLLLVYNFQNILFYSLNEMESEGKHVSFCAFDEFYAPHYLLITQYLVPVFNLFLFVFLPLLIGGVQVLLDLSYLIRLRKEQTKLYKKLDEEHIEWPLYAYFAAYALVFVPLFFHQLTELALGTKKFPFVFPLFIQLKFSSKVWLVVLEMSSLFALCAMDLLIWLLVDKNMRLLAVCWLKKYMLCRTNKSASTTLVVKNNKKLLKSSSGSGSTPNSDSTEASSAKTSSDLCAINDNDVASKSLLEKNGHGGGATNTGTLNSTASLSRKKQLILPNITDAIKQTAAIPAGIQHTSVYPYEATLDVNEHNFKMIDTDIDQIADNYVMDGHECDEDDADLAHDYIHDNQSPGEKDTLRKYKSNYENVHPPSFKTAISRLQQQQQNQPQQSQSQLLIVKE